MSFQVIVTIGPAVLDKDKLKKIDECGNCLYRINGAHVDKSLVAKLAEQVRSIIPGAKMILDLPGNKIRTAALSEPLTLIKGEYVELYDYQLNYPDFYKHLKEGDIIRANDSTFTLEVVKAKKSGIKLLSHSDGLLLSNKGLHARGIHSEIPFLFERDHDLIKAACPAGINYLAASFVRTADDVREVKKLISEKNIYFIAKVETAAAVKNLSSILDEIEAILIDRGDLSTEIDILKLAMVQEKIIAEGLRRKKHIYLATQFLKNMETNPIPLISEVIDLCKTVSSGIRGIQLSEETAVGRYPVECVKLVFDALAANK